MSAWAGPSRQPGARSRRAAGGPRAVSPLLALRVPAWSNVGPAARPAPSRSLSDGGRSLLCFGLALLASVLGGVAGVGWVIYEIAASSDGGAGMSGIIILFVGLFGMYCGAVVGALGNIAGVVFAVRGLRSGRPGSGTGMAGLILNGLALLVVGGSSLLVLFGVISSL